MGKKGEAMKRITAYLLAAGLVLSLLFIGSVLLYSGLGRVTGSSLKEREMLVKELETHSDEQQQLAEYWRNAEKEYVAFRQKVLLKLDHFADLRRSLGEKIDANRLSHAGVSYQNRNSADGKLVFVRFSFDVQGSYAQVKNLIWDLERMPHASRIGKANLQYKDAGMLSCSLELEVVFEK
jgi:hypothetical protein